MIQGLVVDDEIHCAQGVCSAIRWEELGVSRLFAAYSKEQAEKILRTEQIDLMITDIEMPMGNGFQLLKWMETEGYFPVTVVLTSYATFEYARQAIAHQCLDYLLKPVSTAKLWETGKRAVEAVYEKRKEDQNHLLAQYWEEDEQKRKIEFWKEILQSPSCLSHEMLVDAAQKKHAVYEKNRLHLPVFFEVAGEGEEEENLRRLCRWLQFQWGDEEECEIFVQDGAVAAVCSCPAEKNTEYYTGELRKKLQQMTASFSETYGKKLVAYMGELKETTHLKEQYQELKKIRHNNVTERGGVIRLSDAEHIIRKREYERPDFETWMEYFRKGDYESLFFRLDQYFDQMIFERRADHETLSKLLHDFMQIFYVTLAEKEIQANLLFEDEDSKKYYRQAEQSIRKLRGWIGFVIQKAREQIEMAGDTNSVAGHIRQYVRQHLREELSRGQIAGELCMSADYVSRVFKQETGMQLSEYITQERMKKARSLLVETGLSVGEISEQVGYDSITYFSRVFKIRNKQTPKEYREKNGKVQKAD